MATLITGGSGFIGLSIAERLIALGDRVVLFDLRHDAELLARSELAGAVIVTGDVREPSDIDDALALAGIDRIIHTAAITPNEERERHEARRIVDVNIGGTVNLLERVAKRSGIKRVVTLSSVAVYGFSSPGAAGVFEEDASRPAPAALYGITKLAAEQATRRLGGLYGIDVRVVRLGPVFGAWEGHTGVRDALSPHHQVLSQAMAGREVVLNRTMRGDWIYSRDAADGIVRVANSHRLEHEVYHVGGGVLTDLSEWCNLLATQIPGFRWSVAESNGAGTVVYSLPQDRAPLGIARLTADTGFRPSYDLGAAAKDYLDWVQCETPHRLSSPLGGDIA